MKIFFISAKKKKKKKMQNFLRQADVQPPKLLSILILLD